VSGGLPPRLLFLVTEDWFFASHFLGFAAAARQAGYAPVVACRVREHAATIEAAGARVVPVEAERGALGLGTLVRTFARYREIIAAERPALVHAIALKPVLIGGLVARLAGVPARVLAPTGLGLLWAAEGAKAEAARAAVRAGVRLADGPGVRFLCENPDDPRALGLDPARVTLVAGAGVPAADFPPRPDPGPGPLRVAVVARMLASKGIADAVAAVRIARARGLDVSLDLWGAPDPSNPRSIAEDELRAWSAEPGVAWRGRTSDASAVWREAHVAMLLSHGGEGLPRTLVEAAASARPILTTDVPGCREVVADGREGCLVPPRAPERAAEALERLADPALRARMGAAARARFERDMTADAVNARVRALYESLRP
jgi:glycosyltransferase involved in cell wall biosynthesis